MRYEERDGVFHIFVEGKEDERAVLRAIVIASYNTAFIEEDAKYFKNPMTDVVADFFVTVNHEPGTAAVLLNRICGRQCKTVVKRVEPGHFVLDPEFQKSRGNPAPVLDMAIRIFIVERMIG